MPDTDSTKETLQNESKAEKSSTMRNVIAIVAIIIIIGLIVYVNYETRPSLLSIAQAAFPVNAKLTPLLERNGRNAITYYYPSANLVLLPPNSATQSVVDYNRVVIHLEFTEDETEGEYEGDMVDGRILYVKLVTVG